MKIYNTLTQTVEPFSMDDHQVSIYVCGITPYDTTHIGHAFVYSTTDVLIRYLQLRGQKVKYVQNVTDIDDDILKRSKQVGVDWKSLGNEWTTRFIEDMKALNVLPPDEYPRASEQIPEIIKDVQKLLDAGKAYQAGGSVYYDVDSFLEFGKLSHLPRGSMLPIANERGNFPDDPNKRDPLDFVLWQAQKPGEPAWPSPWGQGRPGWHIECSTMATRFLGETIDFHGGGMDLCFPHHECEIAQAAPLIDNKSFVRYWMHTAMVGYHGEKMSKSLGNLVLITDVLHTYTPDALRVYLGEHHYRKEWEYDEADLRKAQKRANQFLSAATITSADKAPLESQAAHYASFTRALDDDLDTPRALDVMDALAGDIIEAAQGGRDVSDAQETFREFGQVFGLRLGQEGPETRVQKGWDQHQENFQTNPATA